MVLVPDHDGDALPQTSQFHRYLNIPKRTHSAYKSIAGFEEKIFAMFPVRRVCSPPNSTEMDKDNVKSL